MVKVELVKKYDCALGEGPHWDDLTQTLLFVDIHNSQVLRYNPLTKETKTTIVKESSVGAVVPRSKGGLMVAADHHFSFLNEDTGELDRIKEVNHQFPQSRFNDGKCDPAGRFWAGTMGLEYSFGNPRPKEGVLYCLDKDMSVSEKVSPVDISNGLSWSPDNKTMFYCDTFRLSIDAYDYDINTGEISNMRPVVSFDKTRDGYPDGHTIDADGNLWVALLYTGQIAKVDPNTGQKVSFVKVNETVNKTTSVCFGGPNFDEMYVTTARNVPLQNGEDVSGALFKITELGANGLPANVFGG